MKITIDDKLNSILKMLSDEQLLTATKYIIACMSSDDIVEATNNVECLLCNFFSDKKRKSDTNKKYYKEQRQQCKEEATQTQEQQVQHTTLPEPTVYTEHTATLKVIKKEDVVNDDIWLEAIAMQHYISKEEVVNMLSKFDNFCVTQEKQHSQQKEYKQHFTNWLRRVQASKRAEQQSTTNTTTPAPIDYNKQFNSLLYRLGDTSRAYEVRDDWQRIEEAERRDNKSYSDLKELILQGYTLLEMRIKLNKGIPAPPEPKYTQEYYEQLFVNN